MELFKLRVSKSERLAQLVAQEPLADAEELAAIAETASQNDPRGSSGASG